MRTTVTIDDQLLDQAKDRARQQGQTLGQLLEDALRETLAQDRATPAPVTLRVFRGGGGLMPGVEPTTRGLLAAADEGIPLDRQR